jgi:hypothetical protein
MATSDREAALTAALAELVTLKYGPRDERYRKAKDAAWARAAQLLGPNAYEAELDQRFAKENRRRQFMHDTTPDAARFRPNGICCSLGTNGLTCTGPRFHKGDHSAMVTWPQVDRA